MIGEWIFINKRIPHNMQPPVVNIMEWIYSAANAAGISTSSFQHSCVLIVVIYTIHFFVSNYNIINRVIPSYAYNPIRFANSESVDTVSMKEFINENVPELRENAWSLLNPFLFNGHLQTIFAGIRTFRRVDVLYFQRQILIAEDGGSIALDHVVSKERFNDFDAEKMVVPENQPRDIGDKVRYMTQRELDELHSEDEKAIVIALTGLSGSSAESYIRCLFSRLSKNEDFDLYVINSRGCGNVNISTPKLFCALWTQDIRETIRYFKERYPHRKIYLFGISLGSIVMSNYLAQEGENSQVNLAIALNSIWDLRGSSYFLENGFISSLCYSTALTFPLLMLIKSHSNELIQNPVFKSQYTNEMVRKIWKLKDFDDIFTSKMFGFTCADDYYTHASPIYKIPQIKTPFINVSALDDPITGGMQVGALPLDQAKYNPFITMINTSLGGHVGFFKWNNVRWYADPLAKLLTGFHEKVVSKPGYNVVVDERFLPKPAVLVNGELPVVKL